MTQEIGSADEWREHESIKRLKYKYARALDDRNWTGLRECFTEDLEFNVPSTGPLRGPDEAVRTLRQGFTDFAFTLHECIMPQLTLFDATEAEGLWNIHTLTITNDAMQQPDPEKIHGYGWYKERYRKVGAEWKIARLQLVRSFKDQQPFVSLSNPAA